jgi:threonyl-tRNA synthetase
MLEEKKMEMIKITFPDGNSKEFERGATPEAIAQSISPGLRRKTVGAKINGELFDLNRPILSDGSIELITKGSEEAFEILNHSTAHLLANAIKRLYPHAKFGVGPAIEEGFYYDVDLGEDVITDEDLPKIEKEMSKIQSSAVCINRLDLSRDEALEIFKDDEYKQELISAIPEGEEISVYQQEDFVDLCRGGHVGNTKHIKFFKLLSVAGAYWRGDSNNKVLQRIYGTSWFTKDELEGHLQILQERKERDHRKLGKDLKIFHINSEYGQGLPLWLPNGYTLKKILEDYAFRLERKAGYKHIATPIVGSKKLYETSGHWDLYQEGMYPLMEKDGEENVLRPMSCPHHILVYKTELRSYRDLPLRFSETNAVMHRYEASGALSGLERVRSLSLTDAHLFVTSEQIKDEVKSAYNLVFEAINGLGLEIDYVELALRDSEKGKYHDDDELWNKAESMLREVLEELNVEYKAIEGEAAFYGPKIDIQVRTAMNKVITMSTVQLDFLLPERFDLTYIAEGGEKKRPVMIHRGLISTYERLISILLEQYKGAFPLWMAPKQLDIIPVSNEIHGEYAKEIFELLFDEDVRCEVDDREEKMGKKIRESQTNKVPMSIVLGDKELHERLVTFRRYGEKAQTTLPLDEFVSLIKDEIKNKVR